MFTDTKLSEDVGGGEVGAGTPSALSYIPLRWMVREAVEHTDIIFSERWLNTYRVRRPTSEKELAKYIEKEKADALSESHSAFGWDNLWWILELLPLVTSIHIYGRWIRGIS